MSAPWDVTAGRDQIQEQLEQSRGHLTTVLGKRNAEIKRLRAEIGAEREAKLLWNQKFVKVAEQSERLALALAEITDETLTADERRDIAREALGWSAVEQAATEKET